MIINKKPSALRFAFSACLFSRISIVGPFLSENESGVLRAHRALRDNNSDNWPFLQIKSVFFYRYKQFLPIQTNENVITLSY